MAMNSDLEPEALAAAKDQHTGLKPSASSSAASINEFHLWREITWNMQAHNDNKLLKLLLPSKRRKILQCQKLDLHLNPQFKGAL